MTNDTYRDRDEWLAQIADDRKAGGKLDQLKAGYENLKCTTCNCDGTDHVRADHIRTIN